MTDSYPPFCFYNYVTMTKIVTVGERRRYDKAHLSWDNNNGGWEGIIYAYTLDCPGDPKNGWKYVGCTPEEATRRAKWNNEKSRYSGKKIAEARKHYGIKSFSYSVVETLYDKDIDSLVARLEEREKHYIQEFDSVKNGFNSNEGGTGRSGQKISDDEIKRRNQKRKDNGFHQTEESRNKISKKLTGKKRPEETRVKISKSNSGKKRTQAQTQAQSERMRGTEPKAATIGAKKWVEQNGGGYWKGKEIPEEAKANMKKAQQARGTKVRAVYPDGTTKEFTTMLDAAKECNVGVGSVYNCVKTGGMTKAGYKFEKL